MDTPITITLIICGTIVIVTFMALVFTMWIINKGADFARERRE